MERNPPTLADAKVAARGIESIDEDYERLWRKEDESIPPFIPIRPRAVGGGSELTRGQHNPLVEEPRPKPLAVREPPPLLALPAPGAEGGLGEVERRLEASQLGFQEAVMKQIQSLTDQMTLMVRNQQPSLPSPVESGRHASGLWCVQCGQPRHTKQFCRMGVVRDQRGVGPLPPQPYGGQGHNQYGQGNLRGVQPGPFRQGGVKR